MQFTQNALLLLVAGWLLQLAGAWMQLKHYRQAMSRAGGRWADGYLGSGQSRPRFGRGAIALLEVDPELRTRELQILSGFSVFARFKPVPGARGLPLAELLARHAPGDATSQRERAIQQAARQIEEVRRKQQ